MAESRSVTAARGLRDSYTAAASIAFFQLGFGAVLARLVDPTAFGLVAMAGLAIRSAQFFAQIGIESAVVQRKNLSDDEVRAANALSIGFGSLVAVATYLLAPVIGVLFREPEVVPVVRWLSLSFLFVGFSATSIALLRRKMRFAAMARVDVASYLLGYGVVGLTCAFSGLGVWALVAASLSRVLIASVSFRLLARHAWLPSRNTAAYKGLASFGARVSLVGALEMVGMNLDTFMVGRVLGSESLGYYNRAFTIAYVPAEHAMKSMTRVLVPTFSHVQEELHRVRAAYVDGLTLAGAFSLPLGAFVAAAAATLVAVLLGPDWEPSVPVLRIVALAIPLAILTRIAESIAEAVAALNAKIAIRGVHVILLAVLLVFGMQRGTSGAAAAYVLAQTYACVAYWVLMRRILPRGEGGYVAALGPGLLAALAVGAAVMGIEYASSRVSVPPVVVLLLELVVAGILALVVGLRVGGGRVWRVFDVRFSVSEKGSPGTLLGMIGSVGERLAGVTEAETTNDTPNGDRR